MRLETDYWHAMDKQSAQDMEISSADIGVSANITKKALEQLKTKIFEGAKNVELGFMSAGKGSLGQGGTTPEMHGIEDREDIRELAKINEVDLTVHSAVNIQGFAGLSEGGFKEEARENALNEVKRTLDFAADTAGGGPVVVHTGEFPRPLYSIEKTEEGKEKFKAFKEELEHAPIYLVDKRTGQLQSLRRDAEVAVPIVDEKTGEIKDTKHKLYKDFKNEFDGLPDDLPEKEKNEGRPYKKKYGTPEKYFYAQYFERQRQNSLAQYREFQDRVKRGWGELKKFEEEHKHAKTISDKEEAAEYIRNRLVENQGGRQLPEETIKKIEKDPLGFFENFIKEEGESLKSFQEGLNSYKLGAAEIEQNIKNITTIEEYGVKKSAETLAQAGIYAYEREKAENLTKPLFVAPENIYPEQFGSHPRELRTLILKSREEMAKQLNKDRGISMHEAKEIAEDHIKATFDVGHAYTWKKYFQPLQGESLKQTEERFNKWLKKEVESLAKDKIIGHVHLSDNFGYYDEHLAPGQGHVPIKDFVKTLQKEGFDKKMIVEWGAQPEQLAYQTMTGAWRALNSPIYRIDGTSQSWTDIGQSYFAKTGSPNYVVGDYAPSKDWTLWSETQLE